MKILIAVPAITPGSGLSRYVLTLAKILKENNDILVLTTHDSIDNTFGYNELYKINPLIKIINIGGYKKYVRYLKAIKVINRFSPDILINNYNGLIQYILPFISWKTKVWHILHNDTGDFYRIGAINAWRVTKWIAPTKAIAEHFNQYSSQKYAHRVSVIPHGVEQGLTHKKISDKLEIVFVGVLYEHKGVMELPEIIEGLIAKGIDLHFTIIGDGVLADWLKDQFIKECKKEIVTFKGVLDHDKVYQYMASADIFLYPTHLDAFGLVIAEAMMNGAVPVVTHLPGITDNLIDNNKNGFLIKQGDIDGFIKAIEKISSINLQTSIGQSAKNKAETCFSMSTMKNYYLDNLDNLNKSS